MSERALTRREIRETALRRTAMMLAAGHPITCNGGNPYWLTHHDHEVVMGWDGDDNLVCPECGRVQDLSWVDDCPRGHALNPFSGHCGRCGVDLTSQEPAP